MAPSAPSVTAAPTAVPDVTGGMGGAILYCLAVAAMVALAVWAESEERKKWDAEMREIKRRNDFLDEHNRQHQRHNQNVERLFAEFELVQKATPPKNGKRVTVPVAAAETADTFPPGVRVPAKLGRRGRVEA